MCQTGKPDVLYFGTIPNNKKPRCLAQRGSYKHGRLAGQDETQMWIVIWFAQQGRMARRQLQQPCIIQVLRSSIAERIVFDAGVKPIYLLYRVASRKTVIELKKVRRNDCGGGSEVGRQNN
jgi:hypothetical protein